MTGGIYRGQVFCLGKRLIKYQVARSAYDAMIRATTFDDPIWLGVRFKFIERCKCPKRGVWDKHSTIIVSQR